MFFFITLVSEAAIRGAPYQKGVFKYFAKFTEKHLCQSLFFNRLQPATLLIKIIWYRHFCGFCKTFKNIFFTENLRATASAVLMLPISILPSSTNPSIENTSYQFLPIEALFLSCFKWKI